MRNPLSHSARSAWIETFFHFDDFSFVDGRTPQGVRGLKLASAIESSGMSGRTPQGVRGLKQVPSSFPHPGWWSHSARSAWIETGGEWRQVGNGESHSARSAWIETVGVYPLLRSHWSHSARSAWIETSSSSSSLEDSIFSRTPQGVRGLKLLDTLEYDAQSPVALRKECVD